MWVVSHFCCQTSLLLRSFLFNCEPQRTLPSLRFFCQAFCPSKDVSHIPAYSNYKSLYYHGLERSDLVSWKNVCYFRIPNILNSTQTSCKIFLKIPVSNGIFVVLKKTVDSLYVYNTHTYVDIYISIYM